MKKSSRQSTLTAFYSTSPFARIASSPTGFHRGSQNLAESLTTKHQDLDSEREMGSSLRFAHMKESNENLKQYVSDLQSTLLQNRLNSDSGQMSALSRDNVQLSKLLKRMDNKYQKKKAECKELFKKQVKQQSRAEQPKNAYEYELLVELSPISRNAKNIIQLEDSPKARIGVLKEIQEIVAQYQHYHNIITQICQSAQIQLNQLNKETIQNLFHRDDLQKLANLIEKHTQTRPQTFEQIHNTIQNSFLLRDSESQKIKELAKKSQELHHQNKNLFHALQQQEIQMNNLKQQNQQMTLQIADMNQTIQKDLIQENIHLKDEVSRKNSIISQYSQLDQKARNAQSEKRIQQMEETITGLQDLLLIKQKDIEEKNQQNLQLSQNQLDLESTLNQFELQRKQAENELQQIKVRLSKDGKETQNSNIKYDTLRRIKQQQLVTYQRILADHSTLEKEYEQLKVQSSQILHIKMQELTEYTMKYQKLQLSLNEAQNQIKKLTENHEFEETQLESLKLENQDLKKENNSLKSKNFTLKLNMDQNNAEITQQHQMIVEQYEKDFQINQEAVENLNSQLDEKSQQLEYSTIKHNKELQALKQSLDEQIKLNQTLWDQVTEKDDLIKSQASDIQQLQQQDSKFNQLYNETKDLTTQLTNLKQKDQESINIIKSQSENISALQSQIKLMQIQKSKSDQKDQEITQLLDHQKEKIIKHEQTIEELYQQSIHKENLLKQQNEKLKSLDLQNIKLSQQLQQLQQQQQQQQLQLQQQRQPCSSDQQKVHSLLLQIKNFEIEKEQLNNQILELNQNALNNQEAFNKMNQENKKVKQLEIEVKNLQAVNLELTQEKNENSNIVEKYVQEFNAIQQKYKSFEYESQQQIEYLSQQIKTLQQSNDLNIQENLLKAAQIDLLKKEYNLQQKEIQTFQEEYVANEELLKQQYIQIQYSLNQANLDHQQQITQLNTEIADMKLQLQEEKQNYSKQIEQLNQQIIYLQQQNDNSASSDKEQITQLNTQIAELKQQLQAEKQAYLKQIQQLDQQMIYLQKQNENSSSQDKQQITQLNTEIAELKIQLQAENQKYQKQMEQLNLQITDLQQQNDNSSFQDKQQITQLNIEIAELKQQLQTEKQAYLKQIEQLNQQITDLQQQNDNSSSQDKYQITQLNTQIAELKLQLQGAETEKAKFTQTEEEWQMKINKLMVQVQNLSTTNVQLEQSVSQLQAQIRQQKNNQEEEILTIQLDQQRQYEAQKYQIEQLEQQLQKLNQQQNGMQGIQLQDEKKQKQNLEELNLSKQLIFYQCLQKLIDDLLRNKPALYAEMEFQLTKQEQLELQSYAKEIQILKAKLPNRTVLSNIKEVQNEDNLSFSSGEDQPKDNNNSFIEGLSLILGDQKEQESSMKQQMSQTQELNILKTKLDSANEENQKLIKKLQQLVERLAMKDTDLVKLNDMARDYKHKLMTLQKTSVDPQAVHAKAHLKDCLKKFLTVCGPKVQDFNLAEVILNTLFQFLDFSDQDKELLLEEIAVKGGDKKKGIVGILFRK